MVPPHRSALRYDWPLLYISKLWVMLSLPLSAELVPLRLFYGKWGILVFCSSGWGGSRWKERSCFSVRIHGFVNLSSTSFVAIRGGPRTRDSALWNFQTENECPGPKKGGRVSVFIWDHVHFIFAIERLDPSGEKKEGMRYSLYLFAIH